jgi:hypothetical protein
MPICTRHGEQGYHAFACRDVCIALATGGPSIDVAWWRCTLDGQPIFASLLCSECIAQYHLPPSPAALDAPCFPEDGPHNLLAIPVCMRCFEEWRLARGVEVAGDYPGIPAAPSTPRDT